MQDVIAKLNPALIAAINTNCSDAECPPAAAMLRLQLLQPIDFEKLDPHNYSVQGRKGGLKAGLILAASVRESQSPLISHFGPNSPVPPFASS